MPRLTELLSFLKQELAYEVYDSLGWRKERSLWWNLGECDFIIVFIELSLFLIINNIYHQQLWNLDGSLIDDMHLKWWYSIISYGTILRWTLHSCSLTCCRLIPKKYLIRLSSSLCLPWGPLLLCSSLPSWLVWAVEPNGPLPAWVENSSSWAEEYVYFWRRVRGKVNHWIKIR